MDVLIASHHGGIYKRSSKAQVPKSRQQGTVVYSYGIRPDGTLNKHKHPSKVADYRSKGWSAEIHTPSSEFIQEVF